MIPPPASQHASGAGSTSLHLRLTLQTRSLCTGRPSPPCRPFAAAAALSAACNCGRWPAANRHRQGPLSCPGWCRRLPALPTLRAEPRPRTRGWLREACRRGPAYASSCGLQNAASRMSKHRSDGATVWLSKASCWTCSSPVKNSRCVPSAANSRSTSLEMGRAGPTALALAQEQATTASPTSSPQVLLWGWRRILARLRLGGLCCYINCGLCRWQRWQNPVRFGPNVIGHGHSGLGSNGVPNKSSALQPNAVRHKAH